MDDHDFLSNWLDKKRPGRTQSKKFIADSDKLFLRYEDCIVPYLERAEPYKQKEVFLLRNNRIFTQILNKNGLAFRKVYFARCDKIIIVALFPLDNHTLTDNDIINSILMHLLLLFSTNVDKNLFTRLFEGISELLERILDRIQILFRMLKTPRHELDSLIGKLEIIMTNERKLKIDELVCEVDALKLFTNLNDSFELLLANGNNFYTHEILRHSVNWRICQIFQAIISQNFIPVAQYIFNLDVNILIYSSLLLICLFGIDVFTYFAKSPGSAAFLHFFKPIIGRYIETDERIRKFYVIDFIDRKVQQLNHKIFNLERVQW